MIMNNRRVFYDESIWERFENQLKTWTYGLMHELLQNQVCSPFLYKFLILIETIQLIYYSIHPQLNFLFSTVWFTYYQDLLQYFQVNYIVDNGGLSVVLVVLYICFSVQIIMLILVILISVKLHSNKRKSSTFLTYILKIYSLYGLLTNTIFTIPFFNAFIAVIYCNSNANFSTGLDCYQGIHFLHVALGAVGLILFLINMFFFCLLYVELNPSSQIPFSAPQSKNLLVKQLLKIVLPLYVTLDYGGNICKVYIALLGVFYLIMLAQRYRTPPFYNKTVQVFIIVEEVLIFWTTLVSIFTAFLDQDQVDNMGLFYLIWGMPFAPILYNQLLKYRYWNLLKTPIKQFKKETDIEIYTNYLIDLIETREQPHSRIILEGVLKLHVKNCNKSSENCVCTQICQDNLKDEESPQKLKRWYLLIKSIISDSLDRFPKCPRLHLLNAYIHHEKLKNKFKALFELMITEENKPNMQEEFSIYRYKNLIEEEMIENDIRTSENKGVDVNIIVIFQNKFVTFLGSIEKSVTLHMEFWRELLEENPDIQKLQSLGSKITNTVESTNDFFKKLTDMNPNHIKCLQIYGNFLKEIVNDDVEGSRILEKSEYISKSTAVNKMGQDADRQKYGENSNTCIITCSGNYNNIGIVTNTNNEITRILGFSKSDIIGQNVNRTMPKVYADQHDMFMKQYLETSESKIIGSERILLAQNKSNYLVPCTLMIKVLPNLEEGIQIVGFLKDIEQGGTYMRSEQDMDQELHYMIINANTFVIMGITQSCYQKFGIPSSLVYGNSTNTNEFTIDAICPELADGKNVDELKTSGLVTSLDTTQIQQNFLLGRGESDDELSMEDEENIYEPPQQINNQSQLQSRVGEGSKLGDSNLGQMLSQNGGAYKETTVDVSNQQVNVNPTPDDIQRKKMIKTQRYKKYKIKAYIMDENEFGDQKIQIIKFHEVDDNEDVNKQKSVEPEEQLAAYQTKNQVKEEQLQQVPEENNQSDGESNLSGGSVNDDMRQLKDFKAMISEKNEPKSIRILKRTVWFIMLILIVLSGLILGYKIQQNSDMQEGTTGIFQAYQRHDIMADVNFYTRLLAMLGNGTYSAYTTSRASTNATMQTNFVTNLTNLVNNLQTVQFNVIKDRIKMDARTGSTASSTTEYNIQFLLTSGAIQVYQNIYNDALFQYITSASSLRNASLASFAVYFNATNNTINNDQKNFFYVVTNGLFVLLDGSAAIAQLFFDFYQNLISDYSTTFYVIMAVGIFSLVVSCMVLIPIVFQVHKTNNRVMSLFGIIPIPEIRELAIKCEKYMQMFLQDVSEKREVVVDPEVQKKNDAPPAPEEQLDHSRNDVYEVNNEDPSEEKKPSTANPNAINTPITVNPSVIKAANIPSAFTQGQTKNDQKQVQKDQEKKENEDEIENLRSQKLLNSKDNNKSIVIIQFLVFALIFIAYFILDISLELQYLSNVKLIYNHLQYASLRPIVVKYNVLFTLEQVVNNKTQIGADNVTDMRLSFQTQLYNNERNIFQSLTNSFPSQFNPYISSFNAFTYSNLCSNAFTSGTFTLDTAGCTAVDSGLLQSGLKTAMTTIALTTNDMISFWQGYATNYPTLKGNNATADMINKQGYFDKLQFLIKYVTPACDYLTSQFTDNISSFLNYQNQIEEIKFSIYMVIMFLVFIIFWMPYLNNLSKQIWRTKGMLNMIPMEIIQKYPNLKQNFIGGDILQAVK